MSYRKHILLILICLSAVVTNTLGQDSKTYSFEFRGDPLPQVLKEVAHTTGTDMVFDPQILDDESIYQRIREQAMPALLSDILSGTPFDYIVLSSGTVVIVRSVTDEPAYGSLSGKIKDSLTGEPLHGATVFLADASGGTATNRNGNFTFNRMMSGTYRIIFSYVGYEPVEKTIEILPDSQQKTEIALNPKPILISPVVVRGHRPDLGGINNTQSGETLDNWEIAGGRRHAIRGLSLFSGVQHGLPMQDIHLQGGRQGEHRIRLDNIPFYSPYQFGELYSAFSPLAIGEIRLHKAGYGAEEGSMIAGIIDLQHKLPADDMKGGTMLGDPLSVNVRGDWSLLTESESSLKLTGTLRSNFWDLYKEPVMNRTLEDWDYVDPLLTNQILDPDRDISEYRPLRQISDVRFLDSHAALRYEADPYNTIRSSFYLGRNKIGTSHLGEALPGSLYSDYLFTTDHYEWNNLVGQISWDSQPGTRLTVTTQAGFSSNRMSHYYRMSTRELPSFGRDAAPGSDFHSAIDMYSEFKNMEAELPSQEGQNRITHGIIRSDLTYSISPKVNVDAGAEYNVVSSSVDFSEFFFLPTRNVQNSSIFSFYMNLNRRFGNYWQTKAGSRFTYTDSHQPLFIEPRFTIQYDRPDTRIGYWSGRLSGGLYRQFVNQYEITNIGPTSLVPSFTIWSHAVTANIPKAYHLSGSWINQPSEHTSLKLEAYYKWQPSAYITSHENLLSGYSVDRSSASAFAENTQMRSRGVSFRLHQQLTATKHRLMLGYDYNQTDLDMQTQFGRTVPASWNEPHRLQMRTILRFFENISVVMNWQSIYGRKWGFRQAYYDFLFLQNVRQIGDFTFRNPEDDRLEPFHQLDLSLHYRPDIGPVHLDIRANLINVLNRRNTIDWSLQPQQSADEPDEEFTIKKRTMPGFYPTFSVEARF